MDVTGGLADAVSKITAALPQVEASVAADLQMALQGIQTEMAAVEAAETKIVAAVQAAGAALIEKAAAELKPFLDLADTLNATLKRLAPEGKP